MEEPPFPISRTETWRLPLELCVMKSGDKWVRLWFHFLGLSHQSGNIYSECGVVT